MGGPCRTVIGREAGNFINNKDLPPIDEKAASKSLALYDQPMELYDRISNRLDQRVPYRTNVQLCITNPQLLRFFECLTAHSTAYNAGEYFRVKKF